MNWTVDWSTHDCWLRSLADDDLIARDLDDARRRPAGRVVVDLELRLRVDAVLDTAVEQLSLLDECDHLGVGLRQVKVHHVIGFLVVKHRPTTAVDSVLGGGVSFPIPDRFVATVVRLKETLLGISTADDVARLGGVATVELGHQADVEELKVFARGDFASAGGEKQERKDETHGGLQCISTGGGNARLLAPLYSDDYGRTSLFQSSS